MLPNIPDETADSRFGTRAGDRPPPVDPFDVGDDALDRRRGRIVEFVAGAVRDSGTDGVVLAVSGGIDAAVATVLAVEALGADRVFGLLLPSYKATESDAHTAELLAEGLGIEYRKVQLLPFVHLFRELAVPERDPPDGVRAMTNAVDRIRTACAYYAANVLDRLVLGTENRTEWLLGTATKYGVRRGDLLPLGDCYRTEVRALAGHIGLPTGVWEREGDRGTIGPGALDPSALDALLVRLVDEDQGIGQTAVDLGIDEAVVRRYATRVVESGHKRRPAPTPRTAATGYDRFHEIELQF